MKVALPRPARTAWRFGSVVPLWVPGLTFTVTGEKTVYTVDTFSKSISKSEKLDAEAKPVDYVADPAKVDVKKCCGNPNF